MKNLLKELLSILRENWQPYFWISLFFYGIIVMVVILSQNDPEAHMKALIAAGNSAESGPLSFVKDAYYLNRNIPLAIFYTFSINLIFGALVYIALPSLIIPFAGILAIFFRGFLWGLSNGFALFTWDHLGVVILEGQAYILTALAAYLLAVRFINPARYNFKSHKEGYMAGLKIMGRISALAAAVLLLSACFEVSVSSIGFKFIHVIQPVRELGFDGANVKMKFSGAGVYYNPSEIKESDAKVVGLSLENIVYFKPGDENAVLLEKKEHKYIIQLYLDKKFWNSNSIIRSFKNIENKLEELYGGRTYRIQAFCYNSVGGKDIKYF